jgi:hypothetical protein
MRPVSKIMRVLALAAVLAALSGCAEYLDRRDTIALSAGDAVATDKVTQMVDPWPRASADKNIAFNGAKMESAVERYRTNQVYPPRGIGTSTAYQQSGGSSSAPVAPAVAQPVAPPPPVK